VQFNRWHIVERFLQACQVSTESKPLSNTDELANAKPFSAIPGPRLLPLIYNLLSSSIFWKKDVASEDLTKGFEAYGPIFKVKLGAFSLVNICDVDGVEKLCRQEGKYPRRIIVESWRHWRDEQGLSRGILTNDGPDWKRMRVLLDKQLLQPRHVATYTNNFNEVVSDLIERLKRIRETKGKGLTVPDIDQELFCWSLETVGTVLYEIRFGGLSETRQPEMSRFIDAVQNIFITTIKLLYLPVKINRIIFPKLQKLHEDSWETAFRITKKLIDRKYAEIHEKLERGEETSGFLSYLLSTNMSKEEVYGNIADIMLGAVDTTSNTMQWVLYELSRHSDIQEQLHAEVTSVVSAGCLPSYDNLQEMPFLKAIVKEVLRLYPVVGVAARVLNDDIVLCGYHIPVNTTVLGSTFVLGRDPKQFKDPLAFKPERWLRSDSNDAIHNFAWLPFGFGPRSCIGRRVAELEMHLLLARISQKFVLKPADNKPLKPCIRGFLVPERPVDVQFIDR